MEVPYTRIGPGQSARLVWQVMGQDGPVANPRNIRYVAAHAGEAGLPSPVPAGVPALPDASAVMGALQLANLGMAVVNLAVTTAVLVEVKKQTRMLRELQAGMSEVRAGVSELLIRAERIDVNVAEVHLRESLRHALKSAVKGSEVDLVVLSELAGEALARFCEPLEGVSPGKHPELRLSEDVQEMAEATLHLLWAARLTAIEAHNLFCAGDPLRVVRDDGVQQFLQSLAVHGATEALLDRHATGLANGVADELRKNKLFIGSSGWVRALLQHRVNALAADLQLHPLASDARTLLNQVAGDKTFAEASARGAREVERVLHEYLTAWTAHTDAGLIWRLQHEVALQGDVQYWKLLEDWLQPLDDATGGMDKGVQREFVTAPA